jgi:hypothetical protein
MTATRKLSKLAARFRTNKRANPVNVQTLTERDGKVGWEFMDRRGLTGREEVRREAVEGLGSLRLRGE